MKNILLLTEIFPPYPGIGGRRWAKFSKYFTQLGFHVEVIAAPYYASKHTKSIWTNDVIDNPSIHVHHHKLNYPEILNIVPKTFVEKIKYHLAKKYLSFFNDGNIYDRTIFWKKSYVKKVEEIINNNKIDTIFITVAPLNLAFQILHLKTKYSGIKFIVDFRDPWVLGNSYGFPQKNKKRQQVEFEKEKAVCNSFDLITFPNADMLHESKNAFNLNLHKCYVLPHGFDKDDFKIQKQLEVESQIVKIIYIGTLYEGLKKYFDAIFLAITNLENLKLEFYTSNKKPEYFELINQNVLLYNEISPTMLFNKIADANFVLIVYNENMEAYMYTKIIEIIYARTPIILICNKNGTTDFIVKNRLGIQINYENIQTELPKILSNKKMKDYNFSFDTSEFSFENITRKLIEKIQTL